MDMNSATDTDSEADYPIQMAPSPGFSAVTLNGSSLEEVEVALAVLQSVETHLLTKVFRTSAQRELLSFCQDVAYINTIRRACSTLVCALRELASPDPSDRDGLIEVFTKISSEWSLSRLLAYRREFRHIAALSTSDAVSVASCVHDTDGMKGTLARQEEDEDIRAASQLPYTWYEMVELLTSDTASRTVLRLSLRLTFAAYILHPQLSGEQFHAELDDQDHAPTAREAIIEVLTHVSTDELQTTIRALQEERSSRFLPMLEKTIDALEMDIRSAVESRAPLASATIRTICLTMNFVILCCGTSLSLCSGAPVSALLSSLLTYASELNTSCFSCHLLMATSALEGSRRDFPPKKLTSL
ncbi:hypothetical protein BGW80DRAFT_1453333 [Lactifluus volemus]|nr:hypothetical protein BGW80DRAFT_1453333 [Lactifluus volemus]